MTLLDILSPASTIVDLRCDTKEVIIAELVDSLSASEAISDRDKVLQAVLEREKIMSTGIGDGIAIPHGKSDSVVKLVAALGTQRRGVILKHWTENRLTCFSCWYRRPTYPVHILKHSPEYLDS